MWYPAKVTAPATQEPVTLDEAKRQLHVDFDDEDDYIDLLIKAARNHVEKYCNIRLGTQSVDLKCDAWCDFARLPVAPVQSIDVISYIASDGTSATLASSEYELRSEDLEGEIVRAYGKQWPVIQPGSRITVSAIAGYDDVPTAVKLAMLLLIGHWFDNREAVTTDQKGLADTPMAVDALLSNHRRGE
ncbi:head-tail connector protein [Rhizobium sp. P44RR-XXIV]|uniref:head-tail connector protein n=1 Tax=Rhizobium sp. P44RR-XXIV TaxID=1921145 RepID=UPI000987B951|nr:head-tail connector protein [Rhizobium sp. P44RR-XXIV]TIX89195.1 hypothetical protein BSK43_021560 [Rhizobium sp. P44RR-XXIV]